VTLSSADLGDVDEGRRDRWAGWMPTRSPRTTITVVAAAVVVAAAAGAPLLYDGAFFFYQAVNRQQIVIPQARITFGLLLWPVVVASHLTDNVALLRLAFGLPLAVTPVISLAASWWIVRRDRPELFVWAAFGVLLVNLPGQTHWVATSLRTNQLLWPVLLAVLIGLPDRVLPVVAVLALAAVNLHPQATVYFFFIAGTCVILASRQPDGRDRYLAAAGVFAVAGMYRAGVVAPGYEVDEASASNQAAQWKESVLGWPLAMLVGVFATSALLVVARLRPTRRRPLILLAAALSVAGGLAMLGWSADPSLWRSAIQYRGPSMFHGLAMMTVAVVDRLAGDRYRSGPPADVLGARMGFATGAAVVFAAVIVTQAAGVRSERQAILAEMRSAPTGCVPYSAVSSLAGSPLDFWSTPAMSLLIDGTRPSRILLPDSACTEAVASGRIPVTTLDNDDIVKDRHIDHGALRSGMDEQHPCRVRFSSGWSGVEELPSGTLRRMTASRSRLEVDLTEPETIALRGTAWRPTGVEDLEIVVDGQMADRVDFASGPFTALTGRALALEAGHHVIELRDAAHRTGPDGATLLDLGLSIDNGQTACRVIS